MTKTKPVFTQVICNNEDEIERWKEVLKKANWTNITVEEIRKWVIRGSKTNSRGRKKHAKNS